MIVDTPAIVAVILEEPQSERLLELMLREPALGIGTPTLAESGIVLTSRLGPDWRMFLSGLVERIDLVPVTFGEAHWDQAVAAHERFGKGRHPAGLNLGDCMAYAVARLADEPLLTLDDGFRLTDLELVLPQA